MDRYLEECVVKIEEHVHGNYKLIIKHYKTGENTWNYTQGFIYNGDNFIGSIKRNYSEFPYCFFGHYLVSGRSYMKQTFIDCNTGELFDNTDDPNASQFCWSEIYAMNSNTLAVHGCFWGAGYEFKFFDVSDLSKGWPEIKYDKSIYKYMEPDLCHVKVENDKIIIKSHEDYDEETDEPINDIYIITLERQENNIVVNNLWLCPSLQIIAYHDMYKYLLKRLEEYGVNVFEYIQDKNIIIYFQHDGYNSIYIKDDKIHYCGKETHQFELTKEAVDENLKKFLIH